MIEHVTNGDFETGDLTGWTPSGTVTVSGSPGSYIANITGGRAYILQSVDLTNINSLTFLNYRGTNGVVLIDDVSVLSGFFDADWTTHTIDVSRYTGTHVIKFKNSASSGTLWSIDNVSALEYAKAMTLAANARTKTITATTRATLNSTRRTVSIGVSE
jgi:hypothetical protein